MPRHGGPRKHVAKDGSVTWGQRIDLPADPLTGERRQQRVRRRTKRDLELAVAQLRADVAAGTATRPTTLTLRELAEGWLERDIVPRMRPSTVTLYRDMVRHHILPLLGSLTLSQMTPEVLDAYYAHLTTAGTSTYIQGKCHLHLRAMLGRALRLGLLKSNPTSVVKPVPHTPRRFSVWTAEETRRFLAAAATCRYGPIWLLVAATGMRRGEALGLRWVDVDWAASTVRIEEALTRQGTWKHEQGGQPKTATSRRTVPIPPAVLEALRTHQERQDARATLFGETWPQTGLVFTSDVGTPIQPPNLYRDYRRLEAAAGLPHIRIHDQRHSTATQARESGASLEGIAGLLGHRDSSITAKIYVQTTRPMVDEAARHIQAALFPGPLKAPPADDCATDVPLEPISRPDGEGSPEVATEEEGRA